MHNWTIFLIGFVNTQIPHIIKKARIKAFYAALNLLRHDNFVIANNFENLFFK